MKDELGGKIIITFLALRPETYSYLTDENKKVKFPRNCLIKRKIKFKNYKNYLEASRLQNYCKLLR